MDTEIYKKPESELREEEPKEVIVVPSEARFTWFMKIATGVLAAINAAIMLSFIREINMELITVLIVAITLPIFVIYCLAAMRGKKIYLKTREPAESALGIWGYIWRSLIIQYVAAVLAAIFLNLSGLSYIGIASPVVFTIVSGLLNLPFVVMVVWLLFSRRKREQLNWIVSLIRKY